MVTRDARSGVPSRLRSRLSASSRHRRRGRSGSERLSLGPKGRAHDRPQARSETEQHNSRKSTWTAPHRNAAERVPIGRKRPPVDGHERAWALDDDCRIGARRRRGEVEAVCGLCVSLSPRLGHALPGRPSKRAHCVSLSFRTRIFTRIALRLHRTLNMRSSVAIVAAALAAGAAAAPQDAKTVTVNGVEAVMSTTKPGAQAMASFQCPSGTALVRPRVRPTSLTRVDLRHRDQARALDQRCQMPGRSRSLGRCGAWPPHFGQWRRCATSLRDRS